jgi:oxygen-dependent protoporphyrinogen oxidase
MRDLKSVSLTSVAVQPKSKRKLRGFGCLFPKAENFKSLGVLFNSDIFERRGHSESENWILPGAVADLDSINEIIRADRKRLTDQDGDFLIVKYFVWLKSLPLYDINLKNFLRSKIFFQREQKDPMIDGFCISMNEKKVYLTGNYLAGIGLAKILSYNLRLSDRIVRDLQ